MKPLKARIVQRNGIRTPAADSMARLTAGVGAPRGFLLTDLNFKPLYANDVAMSILTFAHGDAATIVTIAQRLRTILHANRFAHGLAAAEFVSGERLYVCHLQLLESRGSRTLPMVVLLLERRVHESPPLWELTRQFRLSPRERETVRYLSQGLTTKEVAQHMRVSPNTVKQFVRLIMSKMGVTTRSGIVGKLVAC
jgi:DNA-binding CsgD family transcriptional regulator